MPPQMGPGNRNNARYAGKSKPKNIRSVIKRLFGYIGKDKNKVIFAIFCVVLSSGASLAGTYMLRPVIDNLGMDIPAPEKIQNLALGLAVMVCIYLTGVIASFVQARIMIKVSQATLRRIRDDLFAKLQTLSVRYFDSNNAGDIMSRFTNDVDNIGQMFDSTVLQMFSGILTLVGSIVLMFITNVPLATVTLVITPLMAFVSATIAKHTRKYFGKQQAQLGTVNGYIEEMITGQKVVKVFSHEEAVKAEFGKLNKELRDIQVRANFLGGIMGPCMNALSQVSYTVTAFIGSIITLFTRIGRFGPDSCICQLFKTFFKTDKRDFKPDKCRNVSTCRSGKSIFGYGPAG